MQQKAAAESTAGACLELLAKCGINDRVDVQRPGHSGLRRSQPT